MALVKLENSGKTPRGWHEDRLKSLVRMLPENSSIRCTSGDG